MGVRCKMMLATAFVALACVLAASADPAADLVPYIQSSTDQVHAVWINDRIVQTFRIQDGAAARRKRLVRWGEDSQSDETDLNESTMCSLTCAMQFKSAASRLRESMSLTTTGTTDENWSINQNVNVSQFVESCQTMRPSIQCFDRCPESALKSQLKKSLDPLRYTCIDRFLDIKNNARCMHKMAIETAARCRPQCRRYEDAVARLRSYTNRPYARYIYSESQVGHMLSDTCNYIRCSMDCSTPLVRRVCGQTAATLTKDIIQRLMGSIENLSSMTAGSSYLPESCRRLAVPDDPTPVDSDSDGNVEVTMSEPTRAPARQDHYDRSEEDGE